MLRLQLFHRSEMSSEILLSFTNEDALQRAAAMVSLCWKPKKKTSKTRDARDSSDRQ